MIRKTHRTISCICLISMLLAACSVDNAELYRYINQIKTRPSRPIEPIPQFSPLPIYKFPDNDGRRSPFRPVDQKKRGDLLAPDSNRKKQPLEVFPLDALRYVGLLKEQNQVWALIQQPDKQVTRIAIGDYMGQNYGKVIEIKENFIKLQETVKITGKWENQTTTINLTAGN